ncbi:MAG: hypothetical protein ACR2JW_01915 [Thermomicrobiales bacterium]
MAEAMQPMDDGMLRAYLDGDPVLDDAARARVAAALVVQPALAERLAALRADATAVDAAFAGFATPEPDAAHLAHAYRRVQTRLTTERHTSLVESIKERFATMTTYNRGASVRRYAFAGGLGAVALVCLLVFAPVTDAFDAIVNTFSYHPTKVSVITINTSNFPQFQNGPLNGNGAPATGAKPPATGSKPAGSPTAQDQQKMMQELSKYVSVTSSIGQGQLPGREVPNAAAEQQVVGRAVSAPTTLPPGVANTPKYYVSDHQTADATLHLNEIRPTLTQVGMASLIPATGDSATVHMDAPPASIVSYGLDPTAQGAAAQNQKGVAVIAMGVPTIDVNGLDVPGIISVLGTLPNIPADLVGQLKAADLQHTLIIPVTNDQVVTHDAINTGSTTISQKDGSMSVVIWITTGNGPDVLHVVAGTYDGATVEGVAKSVK